MKKQFFLLALFVLPPLIFVAAWEMPPLSLGLGIEGNMNVRRSAAMGENITLDCGINEIFAGGIRLGFSQDFKRIQVIEQGVFFRWYFVDLSGPRFFVQADLGAAIAMEDFRPHPAILGGFTGGVRIPLNDWYVEPFIRGGYPFIWGAGLIAGYRF
jgi:hypothetical protein